MGYSTDAHSAASLTVSPDRVQHFITESVSLSCEGNSTKWRVRGFGSLSSCSDWGTMTGSTCNIDSSNSIDGVYWCESETGQFSNAVNISRRRESINHLLYLNNFKTPPPNFCTRPKVFAKKSSFKCLLPNTFS